MKKFFFFTLFLISFFFNTNISNAQDNIAFIDLNIVFDNSNAGKKINKQVTDKKKKNSKNFNELKKKFDADRDKLIAQKNVISPEEYEKKLMSGNILAFADDLENWVKETLHSKITMVTEQGDVEDWNKTDSKFDEKILNELNSYLKVLRQHI